MGNTGVGGEYNDNRFVHESLGVKEFEVNALGIILISRGCFERCCSKNVTGATDCYNHFMASMVSCMSACFSSVFCM